MYKENNLDRFESELSRILEEDINFVLPNDIQEAINSLNKKRNLYNFEQEISKMQAGGIFTEFNYDKNSAPKQGDYLLPDINRPHYNTTDGEIRSEYKMIIEEDGQFIVIPTVVNGKQLNEDQAIDNYHKSGYHMGKFNTLAEADIESQKRTAKYNFLMNPIGNQDTKITTNYK